jgi:phospholipase/carboxylesterase
MKRVRLAGLDVVLAGGDAAREGGGDGPLVVLLHGFGAPSDDLVPLWRSLDVPRGTRFAFPAAPIDLEVMPGADSRAWWMIDLMRLQEAIERGEMRDLPNEEPPGLDEARARVEELLDSLRSEWHPSAVVLGGFSQGAMLATDVALRTNQAVDGLALLSGSLLAAHHWVPHMEAKAKTRASFPIFQSHGTDDPILPFFLAERLRDELRAAGHDVTFVPFRGGHEIPPPILDGLGGFLSRVLSKT